MKIEKIVANVEKTVEEMRIAPDNLIGALVKLLEIMHAHGLENEAIAALSDCGIVLEIEEK